MAMIVSVLSVVITAVGLVFVIFELRELQHSVRAGAHAAIYERAAEFRSHLVAHPELRRYFFDGAAVSEGDVDRGRILTLAEIYLNYLENTYLTYDSLGRHNRPSLDRFLTGAVASSPVTHELLFSRTSYYSEAFRDHVQRLLDAGQARGSPADSA